MPAYSVIHDGSDRDAWLNARSVGVGASEVPVLFGCGYSDSSELNLYLSKIGEVDKLEETEGMGWGKRLESAILDELAERAELGPRGEKWAGNRSLLHNPAYQCLVCTPDGITSSDEPMEVKNVCNNVDEGEWDGHIPEKFYVQLQSQIAVCGSSCGLFGALIFGGRLVWDWIPRDNALIQEIDNRTRAFWQRVIDRDPPPSNGTSSARKAVFKLSEMLPPKELFHSEIDEALLQWSEFKSQECAAKEKAKNYEARRRAVEDSILLRMGSAANAFTVAGWEFTKTVTTRRAHTVAESVTRGIKIKPPKADKRLL